MQEYYVFTLSRAVIMILATLIFVRASFKRRDLRSWLSAYIAGTISEVFNLFSQEQYDMFELISITFSALSLILIIFAVSWGYYKTFYETSKSHVIPLIFALSTSQIISLALQPLIGVLLVIAFILILRIYIKIKTPTHAFLCFILISGMLNLIGSILQDLGVEGADEFYQFAGIALRIILLVTGIVALIEEKILKSENKYRMAYNRAEFYKDLFVHDINNILQNLEFSLEIISQNLEKPNNQKAINELINIARIQVNRGANLGLNVRKLSDLEGGKIQNKSVEVCETLKYAIEQLKSKFQNEKTDISVDTKGEKFFVNANELLYDTFRIILNNAIRYNDNPIKEVLIKISKDFIDGINYIKIEFIDNGIGMPDEMKKNIFPRIFSKTKSFKRIGLGLLLVNEVIKSFNGIVWVEDKVKGDYKKGSAFILMVPEAF